MVFSPLERECEVVPLTAAGTEAVTVDVVDEGTLNKKNKDAISRTFYFVVVYNTKSESCFYFLSWDDFKFKIATKKMAVHCSVVYNISLYFIKTKG